jgi:hypothetical protein
MQSRIKYLTNNQNYHTFRLIENLQNIDYETIPIYIICFNNGFMVKNTVEALKSKFQNPLIVINNASDSPGTKLILDKLKKKGIKILDQEHNKGHGIICEIETQHQDSYFIITDPDLELNYLPDNTIQVLFEISKIYQKSKKIGLALRIDEVDDIIDNERIINHEKQFWNDIIQYNNYEVYNADIDTTFHLQSPLPKVVYSNHDSNIRLAGEYTVRHLPWHKSYIQKMKKEDYEEYFNDKNKSSSYQGVIQNFWKLNRE